MATNKILIGFGQSYNVGREPMANLGASYTGLKQNLRVFDGTNFECIDSTDNNNQFGQPSNEWAYEFELLNLSGFLNEDIYYLKYSVGGTALYNTGSNWNATSGSLFDNLKTYITSAESWMNARGKDFEWFGCVWDQGQKDANTLAYANAYETNEHDMLNALDAHIGYAIKKYIFPMNLLDVRDYNSTVNAAKVANVAKDTTNRRLLDVTGVTLGVDGIHPGAAGNILMGQRLVTAIKADL